MRFEMLRPAQIRSGDTVTPAPDGVPGAILAILLIRRGRTVPLEALIELIWGDAPPPSAGKNVRNHVMRLRNTLGDSGKRIVRTRGSGYSVPEDAGTYDVAEFMDLSRAGHRELWRGDPASAAGPLERALGLWQGYPFEGIKPLAVISTEREFLQGQWLRTTEDWFDAAMRLGRHREVLPEMERLAAADPVNEHLHAMLMLALHRSGRQKKALAVYDRIRAALNRELAAEPGEGLREAQRVILGPGSLTGRVPGQRAGRRSSPMP